MCDGKWRGTVIIVLIMCCSTAVVDPNQSLDVLAAVANWQRDLTPPPPLGATSCLLFSVRFECIRFPRDITTKETFDNIMHKSSIRLLTVIISNVCNCTVCIICASRFTKHSHPFFSFSKGHSKSDFNSI
jgi:hypothetical protein